MNYSCDCYVAYKNGEIELKIKCHYKTDDFDALNFHKRLCKYRSSSVTTSKLNFAGLLSDALENLELSPSVVHALNEKLNKNPDTTTGFNLIKSDIGLKNCNIFQLSDQGMFTKAYHVVHKQRRRNRSSEFGSKRTYRPLEEDVIELQLSDVANCLGSFSSRRLRKLLKALNNCNVPIVSNLFREYQQNRSVLRELIEHQVFEDVKHLEVNEVF